MTAGLVGVASGAGVVIAYWSVVASPFQRCVAVAVGCSGLAMFKLDAMSQVSFAS